MSPISLLEDYNQHIEVRNERRMAEQIQNHEFRELAPMKSLKQQQLRDPQFYKLRKKQLRQKDYWYNRVKTLMSKQHVKSEGVASSVVETERGSVAATSASHKRNRGNRTLIGSKTTEK